ncbi:MAG: ABC transporter substrate-binding protein [Spirochaetaceae bacterium 4572_7]|nr:MAG: ABC transporter substrate-binding protein [Spirochaetaceae bacterium 4572_7]
MSKFKIVAILLLLISTNTIFSKSNNEVSTQQKSAPFLTITGSKDRVITIEKEPLTIVSLAPGVTEIIFALGRGDRLLGRTDYCDFPEEVSKIPSVGTLFQPNIEKIVELNPDIIIASTHFQQEVLNKLEEASMTVLIVEDQGSFEGVYTNINTIGQVLNATSVANELNNAIKTKIDNVKIALSTLNKPSVYYVVGFGEYGDYTAGGDTFISDIIELAGGKNSAKESKGWSYSLEKIVESNPEIIICSKYFNTKEGIMAAAGYQNLPAIKDGNIFSIDNNLIDRQGPRIAEGLEAMAKIIHPEAF